MESSLRDNSTPFRGSFDDEQVDSSTSMESVDAMVVVLTTNGEAGGFGSSRDGVNGFSSTRGETRQGFSLENNDSGCIGGSSDELVLPFASKLRVNVSLLLSVSCVSSSTTISSVSFVLARAVLLGRPRGRLAGGGASSRSGLPSSKPESLSGGFWLITVVSFGDGTVPEVPLRVLMRTFVGGTVVGESLVIGTVVVTD